MSLEDHKRRERAQAIGLFRYQLICPALDEGLSTKQRGKLVRQIAGQTHSDPFGNQIRVSRETLDRWIRRYRAGGFEALVPTPRMLGARTDAQVLELAASLKQENPTRTATLRLGDPDATDAARRTIAAGERRLLLQSALAQQP